MRWIALFTFLVAVANAQERYKLCVTDKVSEDTCHAVQRGESKVSCLRVTDSVECSIKMAMGEADFGLFNTEELLLAYQFYPKDIVPIFQMKHADRVRQDFQFQAVAVVSANVTPVGHATDFESLKGGGLCHPGFSRTQWWNDYILKFFERTVAAADCQKDLTVTENEVINIKNFFGSACRPGAWAPDSNFDQTLKNKHPELCSLCDDQNSCSYQNKDNHGHIGALDCLASGRGKVAYVALNYVRQYFQSNSSYQFLCMDGTTQPLSTESPCAWISQPWDVIASRKEIAIPLTESLKQWLPGPFGYDDWVVALKMIIQEDTLPVAIPSNTSLVSYLSRGRKVDLEVSQTCNSSPLRWCTIGDLETNKCEWIAKAAQALGIEPQITCRQANSTFQCFRDIASYKADIITIDSNYGHLARTVYGLSTVLYSETENERNSVVMAVVRNAQEPKINSFQDLDSKKACFPEYGGIAWLSFVFTARSNGLFAASDCDYPKLASTFLGGACTPGIKDTDHSNRTPENRREGVTSVLCSQCPNVATQDQTSESFCAAGTKNPYYGDEGALRCLKSGDGDIAFVEANNLKDKTIDPKEYRVLCKNGSLANAPGFNVDDICALSVTIDSEVVGRRNSSDVDNLDTTIALMKIENWLGYRVYAHRPIRIYDKFNDTKDLLFKDTTSGLVNVDSSFRAVQAYKDLFTHVETCSMAPLSAIANLSFIALVTFSTIIFTRIV